MAAVQSDTLRSFSKPNGLSGKPAATELTPEEELELAKLKIDACFQIFISSSKGQKHSFRFIPFWISRRAKKAVNFFRKLVKGINVHI